MLRRVGATLARNLKFNKKQIQPAVNAVGHQKRNFTKAKFFNRRTAGYSLFLTAAAGGLLYVVLFDQHETSAEEGAQKKPRIVVLGSGWGALSFVQDIDSKQYDVTIVSPRNYFLFTPLLPSAIVGTVDIKSIIEPIRKYCKRSNTASEYYEAECVDIDFNRKKIICRDTQHSLPVTNSNGTSNTFEVDYDYLVMAVGATNNTFGTPGVQENCNFLKEVEDALVIRKRILDIFETANLPHLNEEERKKLLHFVVVGGGPNGVEVAAELHDYIRDDLSKFYPHLVGSAQVTLLELMDHILSTYDARISEYAEKHFRRDNIDVRVNTLVTSVTPTEVLVRNAVKGKPVGDPIKIPYGMCVWATGVGVSPLTAKIIQKLPPTIQNNRRALITDGYLQIRGAKDAYALGDCATIAHDKLLSKFVEFVDKYDKDKDGFLTKSDFEEMVKSELKRYPQLDEYAKKIEILFEEADVNKDDKISKEELSAILQKVDSKMKFLPATAQVAAQQGEYLARRFNSLAQGKEFDHTFRYKHFGSFAYVGSERAVAEFPNKMVLSGYGSWWLWRSVYLSKQVSYKNMFMVGQDWLRSQFIGRDITRQ
jgi:NADH:ubiquinone reductase (non-electrogenic)